MSSDVKRNSLKRAVYLAALAYRPYLFHPSALLCDASSIGKGNSLKPSQGKFRTNFPFDLIAEASRGGDFEDVGGMKSRAVEFKQRNRAEGLIRFCRLLSQRRRCLVVINPPPTAGYAREKRLFGDNPEFGREINVCSSGSNVKPSDYANPNTSKAA